MKSIFGLFICLVSLANSNPVTIIKSKNLESTNLKSDSGCKSNGGGNGGGGGGIGGDGGTKNVLAGGTHIFGTNIVLTLDPEMVKHLNFEEIMGKSKKITILKKPKK